MDHLVSIGRFSAMSGLSVKALRHYDALGVLRPARTDGASGYRLYAIDQLRDAALVAELRALDLPLGDVAAIVAAPDGSEARERLLQHRDRLVDRQRATEAALSSLTRLLEQERSVPHDIQLVERPPIAAVVLDTVTADNDDARDQYRATFRTLARQMRAAGLYRGMTIAVSSRDQPGEELRARSGWTVPDGTTVPDGFERLDVPGGTYARAFYAGSYQEQYQAFEAIETWLAESGRRADGDYVLFFNRPPEAVDDDSEARTEILVRLLD